MADTPSFAANRRPRVKNPVLRRYLTAFRTARGIAGSVILLVLVALALLAPVLYPGGYDVQSAESLRGPSLAHPFGTDQLGRDLLTRSLFGLRIDLTIVAVAVPLGMVVGTTLGLIGALSRVAGTVLQRVLDVIIGFPGIVLGMCIILIMGPGWSALVIAITVSSLPTFGRLSRAAMLSQAQREYVMAARTLGVSRVTIITRHILPNAIDPILVAGAVFVVHAIFIEAGLSIIGLGIQPPEPSLGSLLNQGMRYITQAPTYVLGPTVVLFLLALSFSLISDSLNKAVNRA
ncbi:ABC transporter permease [Cryobacterium tagatosivorans]|uniref:ABC transporter permease n=1 Tax=Cryobacterium tagatosivorans TaxID=1259199 RepID=A0A4R8UDZ0_9MICO|nr:ABC transporter permease [Cryobacterium tagatosivorans]TFB51069.1 ABC transporter permease [Cryobacterium tagatosivorans]